MRRFPHQVPKVLRGSDSWSQKKTWSLFWEKCWTGMRLLWLLVSRIFSSAIGLSKVFVDQRHTCD